MNITTIKKEWNEFIYDLPHQKLPYSKKNWGNQNHSLCSYQGKLKPSIAFHLVKIFAPQGGCIFDPFSGVGTIPFEASLNGIKSFGLDISPLAYYVSSAKVHINDEAICYQYIKLIDDYIKGTQLSDDYIETNGNFGFNKTLKDYYHEDTFIEILKVRDFISKNKPKNAEEMLVLSCILHILHGNRPYALSRRSHPIVPYAPTGEFEYKNLIAKATDKLKKSLSIEYPQNFVEGKIIMGDATESWNEDIQNIDAIITSPPFYDSTRFYLANWIRLWFLGWSKDSFESEPLKYVDEKQKIDFSIYDSIFKQGKDRLKKDGFFVMHLGKSPKCNMGEILKKRSLSFFKHAELYDESVVHCEKFGIKDLGTTSSHQYLIMY
jgi:adenine-specific DNA modification methyltransferase